MSADRKSPGLGAIRIGIAIALLTGGLHIQSALAAERLAYDEAAPDTYSEAHATLEDARSRLMKIPGVSLVYLSNDGDITVRVRKIVSELSAQIPERIDRIRIKVVGVQDVLLRHRHELEMISGADHVIRIEVENFPDGQLAIVVRVTQPRYEQPAKVPTDIEGIPLRVLVAQDRLID